MFNNLIESTSHAGEFKRRGSFVLFTTAIYVVLLIVAGVMSIYAYDARLDDQNTEIITMLNPVEFETAPKPAAISPKNSPPKVGNNKQHFVERATAMVDVNRPDIAPDKPSAQPNRNLPLPNSGLYRITGRDFDPGVPGGTGDSKTGGGNVASQVALTVDIGTPPPPTPTPVPKKILTVSTVLNGRAEHLPKPEYPIIAKRAGTEGKVNVQVLIDEYGKVISAKAISGNPMLMSAAQHAALQARFSPTKLNDQAVKVSGVIVYNFMLH